MYSLYRLCGILFNRNLRGVFYFFIYIFQLFITYFNRSLETTRLTFDYNNTILQIVIVLVIVLGHFNKMKVAFIAVRVCIFRQFFDKLRLLVKNILG